MFFLVSGSDRFQKQKEDLCKYLQSQGHTTYEACSYYKQNGGGLNGDRAVEKLIAEKIDGLIICTDETGYCGVITTIRIGLAYFHNLPIYSIGKLADKDYENYVEDTTTDEVLSLF